MQGLGGPPSPEEVEAKAKAAEIEAKFEALTDEEKDVLMHRPMANDLVLRDLRIAARPIRYFKKHAMLSKDGWTQFQRVEKKLGTLARPEIKLILVALILKFGH